MNFGNIGFMEILVILLIVLLLFGAKRIPEIAGSFGKGIREFRKSMTDASREIQDELRTDRPNNISSARDRDALNRPPAEPAAEPDPDRPEPKRLLG
jgi:sec-independent protein translocase protein TatA